VLCNFSFGVLVTPTRDSPKARTLNLIDRMVEKDPDGSIDLWSRLTSGLQAFKGLVTPIIDSPIVNSELTHPKVKVSPDRS
jgi:hypothetical protein